jgi:hypothetical protein
VAPTVFQWQTCVRAGAGAARINIVIESDPSDDNGSGTNHNFVPSKNVLYSSVGDRLGPQPHVKSFSGAADI